MNKECLDIIKIVGLFDSIIGIIVSLILMFFFSWISWFFLLGIVCSLVNFIINSFTTETIIMKDKRFKALLILLSYTARIGLVCGISLAIIKESEVSFFIFIAGYTAQLLAVLCYGFSLKSQEGV
ncbi:ATP synthase subunit I [Clostridium sp.]|uniref:ATP synthase subunit I n=1 Tax=Clostridium sp. TaxID=1506 RepID=UPI00346421A7